jgi:fumarate hydratase class II
LNVAMPMMAWSLLDSIRLLTGASSILQDKCIDGLELDRPVAEGYVERSLMMGTSLAPVIGYENAAKLAKEAHARGLTIRELATEKGLVDAATLDAVLDPRSMTEPHAGTSSAKSGRKSSKKKAAKKTARKAGKKTSSKGATR